MLIRAKPDVLFQQVDGDGVLLSLQEEVYFGLNEVAARIWQMLEAGACTPADLVAQLVVLYPDAPRAMLDADVDELLADLDANGLLERVDAVGASQASVAPARLTRAG